MGKLICLSYGVLFFCVLLIPIKNVGLEVTKEDNVVTIGLGWFHHGSHG